MHHLSLWYQQAARLVARQTESEATRGYDLVDREGRSYAAGAAAVSTDTEPALSAADFATDTAPINSTGAQYAIPQQLSRVELMAVGQFLLDSVPAQQRLMVAYKPKSKVCRSKGAP